jgi:glycosyltransferase involved in cell wall biosynthesis
MNQASSVAVISSEYPPNICGGLGVHVAKITASLRERMKCKIFVPHRGNYAPLHPDIQINEIEVPPHSASELEFWLRFCYATVLSVRSSRFAAEIIHCHDWMTILAGLKLREIFGLPLVFNVHLPEHIGSRLHLENIGLIAADVVIVNSAKVREELLERGLPIRRIQVIPNGVDASEFCLSSEWPNDDGYILFVGRLVAQKGVDLLLQAFSVILRRWPQSHLIILGDGDLELYFKRMVRYLGIGHRVRFVSWQTGPALVRFFQGSQAVVVPSYYEPFGMVALEAMACGRPVIVSEVGGLSEIVEDGIQGYFIPPGDYLELARRLSSLISSPRQRQEMGASARTRALTYNWETSASQTLNLYNCIISQPLATNQRRALERVAQPLINEVDGLAPIAKELLGLIA